MIVMLLLNAQLTCKMFIKILKNTIQENNANMDCIWCYDDMISNKKLNLIVTELFIRDRKLNILLIFITQSL